MEGKKKKDTEAVAAKICNSCGKEAEKRCSTCGDVFYCSVECQRSDWSMHKKVCGGGYVFKVKNRHIKSSPRSSQEVGPAPNITSSSEFDFVAYFDNKHGEQNLVVWDFDKSTHPYFLDGDWTWSKAIPFVGKESFELTELVKGDTVVQVANSHLIGIDKMIILKDLLLVAKKKYEGWKENGGVTHQVSGCTIPYHDVSRRKGCILSVPNHAARVPGLKDDVGLPPCFDAPSRLPEPDSWCTTEMGDKVSIVLKSPVYGHNTFYFDSSQGIGQITMSWDMTTDIAQIWVNYLKWDNVIELGSEFHSKVLKPYGPESDAANEKVLRTLCKEYNVHFEDA